MSSNQGGEDDELLGLVLKDSIHQSLVRYFSLSFPINRCMVHNILADSSGPIISQIEISHKEALRE